MHNERSFPLRDGALLGQYFCQGLAVAEFADDVKPVPVLMELVYLEQVGVIDFLQLADLLLEQLPLLGSHSVLVDDEHALTYFGPPIY